LYIFKNNGAANTNKFKKGEVQLKFSSTLPIQQVIAYSISCSKAEKEIEEIEVKLKKERTSITTVRELFRTFATLQTRLLSHWSLPLTVYLFTVFAIFA
jgi:hypothetical protein